jgi:hypothetical protein
VITAVSYDANGQIFYLSYGWQGDPGTVYGSQVVMATVEITPSAATYLANAGYIITAIGGGDAVASGNNAVSVILVGSSGT